MEWGLTLLRDSRGVYGLGFPGSDDVSIITRPDRVERARTRIAYQRIVPNSLVFKGTREYELFSRLHRLMLERAGLADPARRLFGNGSVFPRALQDEHRRTYFGLRKSAISCCNRLLSEALAAGDAPALGVIRRFPIRFRHDLYAAACKLGPRAVQLCETFPVLALIFFTRYFRAHSRGDTQRIRREGTEMVLRGEKLKKIAAMVGFPMIFRRVKPGAAAQAVTVEIPDELLYRFLPTTLPAQRLWLAAVDRATRFGPDFAVWTARRFADFTRSRSSILAELEDIGDWVKCSVLCETQDPQRGLFPGAVPPMARPAGSRFVTRHFRKEMGLKTVRHLSRRWHEALAANMEQGSVKPFPQPWLQEGEVDGLRMVPLRDSAALYLEAKLMHHCVATYTEDVLRGEAYFYSVRHNDERLATIELRGGGLGQIRGKCNSGVDSRLKQSIKKWLRDYGGPCLRARWNANPSP